LSRGDGGEVAINVSQKFFGFVRPEPGVTCGVEKETEVVDQSRTEQLFQAK
jgi:hypothetical protein